MSGDEPKNVPSLFFSVIASTIIAAEILWSEPATADHDMTRKCMECGEQAEVIVHPECALTEAAIETIKDEQLRAQSMVVPNVGDILMKKYDASAKEVEEFLRYCGYEVSLPRNWKPPRSESRR